MNEIQRYVVLLYARGSELSKVDEARKVEFTQSGNQIESLHPTLAALIEHAKKAMYEGGHMCRQCLVRWPNHPCPGEWCWQKVDHVWKPLWTWLPEAMVGIQELISRGCKMNCTDRCKYVKANFKCTSLCFFVVVTASKLCQSHSPRPRLFHL